MGVPEYGRIAGVPLGKRRTVLLAGDVVRPCETFTSERVVALVDDALFEGGDPKRINRTLVLAAVERTRPEGENPLFG